MQIIFDMFILFYSKFSVTSLVCHDMTKLKVLIYLKIAGI